MEPHNPYKPLASHVRTGAAVSGKLITTENAMHLNQYCMRPKILMTVLVATLMFTAALVAPARAADNKVYAGSNCKPVDETVPTSLYYGNNATNLSLVDDAHVVCPVVRDVTTGPANGPNAYIDVSSNTVSCDFVTTNANGLGTFASVTSVPVFLAAGVYRFDIQGIPQVGQGAYLIDCTLPPSTSILRYSVAE
jgi:hypothetical protein